MSFGQQMYWVGPPVSGVYESAAGLGAYGQPVLPASPEDAAQQLCAIMGGSWNTEALECAVGDTTYKLPDFDPGAMPSGTCGPDEVMTPTGCKPHHGGGVEPECPAGQRMVNGECILCGPGDPRCGGTVGPPQPPQPSVPTENGTPDWVLPAAIGGIAAVAIIALVMTK